MRRIVVEGAGGWGAALGPARADGRALLAGFAAQAEAAARASLGPAGPVALAGLRRLLAALYRGDRRAELAGIKPDVSRTVCLLYTSPSPRD